MKLFIYKIFKIRQIPLPPGTEFITPFEKNGKFAVFENEMPRISLVPASFKIQKGKMEGLEEFVNVFQESGNKQRLENIKQNKLLREIKKKARAVSRRKKIRKVERVLNLKINPHKSAAVALIALSLGILGIGYWRETARTINEYRVAVYTEQVRQIAVGHRQTDVLTDYSELITSNNYNYNNSAQDINPNSKYQISNKIQNPKDLFQAKRVLGVNSYSESYGKNADALPVCLPSGIAGEAKIPAGSFFVRVVFKEPYEHVPMAVISLNGDPVPVFYSVSNLDTKGFTINVLTYNSKPLPFDLQFYWYVFSSPDEKHIASKGQNTDAVLVNQ